MSGSVTVPRPRSGVPDAVRWPHRIVTAIAPDSAEGHLARTATVLALALTLAFLPFEALLFRVSAGPFTFTDLETLELVTVGLWLLALAAERRAPLLPRWIVVGVAGLGVVSVASSLLAGPLTGDALRFTFRSGMFWALFLVAADLVRTERAAGRLVAWLLVGATISAAIGVIAWLVGSDAGLPGAGLTFTVGGISRIAGTFDYPNTAAMAWELTLLVSAPLLLRSAPRSMRVLLGASLLTLVAALVLTISRGALLGMGAGLAVLVVVAAATHARRLGLLAVAVGLLLAVGAVALQVGSSMPLGRLVSEADGSLYGATYVAPGHVTLPPGGEGRFRVTVSNTGQGTWRIDGTDAYSLSYHWVDTITHAELRTNTPRTDFAAPVTPGETVTLDGLVVAPLVPGDYRLAWDVVQEHVVWFSEKSVPTAMTAVAVVAGATASVTDPTGDTGAQPLELYPDLLPVPARADLWDAALRMVRASPILGIGPGLYRHTYGQYLGWSRWDQDIHSNDLYLELASTTGIAGLACFLILLAAVLAPQVRGLVRSRRAPLPSVALRAGFVAAVLAFLVHGIVDYFLGFTPTGILYWAILGIGLGVVLGTTAKPTEASAT